MRPWTTAYTVALRTALLGHLHNRLALLMATLFNPGWIWIGGACLPHTPLTFRLEVVDLTVATDVSHATQITSALPGGATVIGFMMFMTTFKARDMDQRLILAGYSPAALSLARLTAMTAVAAVLATQIALLLRLTVAAPQIGTLWLAAFAACLAYGGIGSMLGALLTSELSGLFSVIACIFLELTLQNPLTNPRADQPWLFLLPLFGPSQSVTAAALTHTSPGLGHAALGLVWCATTSATACAALHARTRSYSRPCRRPAPSLPTCAPGHGRALVKAPDAHP